MVTGVEKDVNAGTATDGPGVAKSLEKNAKYVLGTDDTETRRRICALCKECAVFNPQMCY
jgi:hypothetical protein